MRKGNIAPRDGFELTPLVFMVSVIGITLPRLPDDITQSTSPVYVLPERLVPTTKILFSYHLADK